MKHYLGLGALCLSAFASAGSSVDTYPETPAFNPQLPLIHTQHGSDHLKPNILNPHPVCNASEDRRTVVYRISDNWLPIGTISTTNTTDKEIPLTQTTSRSQTISLSVNGKASQSVTANLGGDASQSNKGGSVGGKWGIAFSLARSINLSASYSLSWNVGQKIGPYAVPAGYTGEATYGFRSVNMSGTQQFCKANGTWSTPSPWRAFVPVKNDVHVKLYKGLEDTSSNAPFAQRIDYTPKPPQVDPALMAQPANLLDYDLAPHLTVSTAKSAGFSGSVALRIKNEGAKAYYGNFPVVSFLVEVKTEEGPEGVDRHINVHTFKGVYAQDLGFDRETSTRRFIVTLSNLLEPTDEILAASFFFFDGNTKLGRLKNSITVHQIGRVDGDTSFYNDQNTTTTRDDFGNPLDDARF